MPALRHSSDREPGYTRRRQGRGWRYLDERGRTVRDPRLKERFAALAIPPAWRDVWICRSSRGHLQATGVDDAGRTQYIYHPAWHEQRQREKYERILRFADGLPGLRRVTAAQLRRRTLDREKALAAAVQLLDRTYIRVGSEQYAGANGTYGLATLRSRHVAIEDDTLVLDFEGKGGVDNHVEVTDARLVRAIAEMDALPGYEVFSYRDAHGEVADVRSADVNAYIKERMGEDFSAKDFRTWAGTVAAAVALDEVGPIEGARERQRAVGARLPARGGAPGQHARGLPGQLHRPAGHRPLPGRAHHLGPEVGRRGEHGRGAHRRGDRRPRAARTGTGGPRALALAPAGTPGEARHIANEGAHREGSRLPRSVLGRRRGGPDPRIETPLDAIVRITTTNICGSDLHMYEGRTSVEEGTVFGHENMGVVEAIGSGVERIEVGDRVSVPFNISCGTCRNCQDGWWSFCLRTNPTEGVDGAAYGYANMGPYRGGQAEYLRVPYADVNLLQLPEGDEHELDFTMLSDIFPTGYHGTELAEVGPGDTVAVFGAGPVGLMAAHSAFIRGAQRVFVVDKEADRLALAESIGADAVEPGRRGPRRADPRGDRRHRRGPRRRGGRLPGPRPPRHRAPGAGARQPGQGRPHRGLDRRGRRVRAGGPGAQDEGAKEGRIAWDYGTFFTKGQRMGTGQAPVKRYNRELRDLIVAGRAQPSFIVSHELGLDEAVDAYDKFDKRCDGYTKVLLHPGG